MDEESRLVAIADALRRVAPDQLHLADSVSFGKRLDGASPAALNFDAQVRAAVHDHVGPTPAELVAEQAAEAEREQAARDADSRFRRARGQWTAEDVEACRSREDMQEMRAAAHRGQLEALGYRMPPRPVGREVVRPVSPSLAQVQRWKNMPPWQAQRERAQWMAEHSQAGEGGAA